MGIQSAMKHCGPRMLLAIVVLAALLAPRDAAAQTLGTFMWRVEPHCNTLVLTVIQDGGLFRVQGYEDQCQDNIAHPPVEGIARVQGGGVALAVSIDGLADRLTATIQLPSLNGGWVDAFGIGTLRPVSAVSRTPTVRRQQRTDPILHVVDATNRPAGAGANVTCFSHPYADGVSTARISVTHNRGSADNIRPAVNSIVSLFFANTGTGLAGALANNVWCISRNDDAAMPLGAGFTIQVLPRHRFLNAPVAGDEPPPR